jgi:hypothetical protein
MFNIKQARLDLREGQFIENDGYGSVWSSKKAQPSSRSSLGIHTILQVNTVWSGRFDQLSRRASKNAPGWSRR